MWAPTGKSFLWEGRVMQPLPGEFAIECLERVEAAERAERERIARANAAEFDGSGVSDGASIDWDAPTYYSM